MIRDNKLKSLAVTTLAVALLVTGAFASPSVTSKAFAAENASEDCVEVQAESKTISIADLKKISIEQMTLAKEKVEEVKFAQISAILANYDIVFYESKYKRDWLYEMNVDEFVSKSKTYADYRHSCMVDAPRMSSLTNYLRDPIGYDNRATLNITNLKQLMEEIKKASAN